MKKLHQYILKSFAFPFILTFFIVIFILLMQFLWKYVDDLVGKGLEWYVILELLWYTSASLVPIGLPLAVLLSSIMTFGNLGEKYELVALKSAGLSLQKIMFPLTIAAIGICLGAFYFSNNLLPKANLKMGSLLWDVRQQRPALNLKQGVFYNGIEGYSIKVNKKNNEDNTLEEIMIYDWYSGHLSLLAATNNIAPGYEGHIYAVTAPIVSGWAFIGEVDKYVTASKLRFPEVTTSGGKLTATVSVVAGETVKVCAAQASTYKLTCQMASKNGTVTFG